MKKEIEICDICEEEADEQGFVACGVCKLQICNSCWDSQTNYIPYENNKLHVCDECVEKIVTEYIQNIEKLKV